MTASRKALVKFSQAFILEHGTRIYCPSLQQESWTLQALSLPLFFSDAPLAPCTNEQTQKVTVLIWRAVQGLEIFVPHAAGFTH